MRELSSNARQPEPPRERRARSPTGKMRRRSDQAGPNRAEPADHPDFGCGGCDAQPSERLPPASRRAWRVNRLQKRHSVAKYSTMILFSCQMRGSEPEMETETGQNASVVVVGDNCGEDGRERIHVSTRVSIQIPGQIRESGHIWCDHWDHSNVGERTIFRARAAALPSARSHGVKLCYA